MKSSKKMNCGQKSSSARIALTWVLSLIMVMVPTYTADGHAGAVDSSGCHKDRIRGEYHCHKERVRGRRFHSSGALRGMHRPDAARVGMQAQAHPPAVQEWRTVVRVVDGDTIVLDRGEKVRLIGVDTPETVDPRRSVQYFGKQASNFTRSIANGKKVRLDYDHSRADRYGRTLAYVYLQSGVFLNAEIIRQGYGFAYLKYPFRYMEEFRRLEHEARLARRGLWK